MQNVAVCTLFEGNYHLGAAALINSFAKNNFSGSFFAGYRGELPPWVKPSEQSPAWMWDGMTVMEINSEFIVYFLPLNTDYHFTNYKPDFMLELWSGPASEAEEMYYLDPDIVLCLNWSEMRRWIQAGVGLCGDVNSPMAQNHPKRVQWREYFPKYGIHLHFKSEIYVNGGFVGLRKSEIEFLQIWKSIQESMAHRIGGLNRSSLKGEALPSSETGVFSPFSKTDQDALNAAVEAFDGPVSILDRDAMGFGLSTAILPHALGQPKPWDKKYFHEAFQGRPPRQVDKEFWKHVRGPIKVFRDAKIRRKNRALQFAVLLARFYRRN